MPKRGDLYECAQKVNQQKAFKKRDEHLYSPRMVGEIKEEKKQLEHQTDKQWYDLTILTTVYNSVTITTKEKPLAYTDIEIS